MLLLSRLLLLLPSLSLKLPGDLWAAAHHGEADAIYGGVAQCICGGILA